MVVGADRVVANGDTANKIGTYALSIIAAHHKVARDVGSSFKEGGGLPGLGRGLMQNLTDHPFDQGSDPRVRSDPAHSLPVVLLYKLWAILPHTRISVPVLHCDALKNPVPLSLVLRSCSSF